MSDKKKISALIAIATIALVLLLVALGKSLSDRESDVGLFNDPEDPPIETAEDREQQQLSKEEMPEATRDNIASVVELHLSSGKFDELDNILALWQEKYRTNEEAQDFDEMDLIEGYRADIAYYKAVSLQHDNPTTPWLFNHADAAAAAVAYAPISTKYMAMVDVHSAIFPPSPTDINLKLSDKTNAELQEQMNVINRARTKEREVFKLLTYDMMIDGRPCELTVIADNATLKWQPYTLRSLDGEPYNDVINVYHTIGTDPLDNVTTEVGALAAAAAQEGA